MSASSPTPLASDVEIAHRVLAHIDARTTDEGEGWREPVANYTNPARFDVERRLLRSVPSVFAPAAAIPNIGDHVDRVVFGVPLFAVRGADGRARVFRNVCRHRGVALVDGSGCSKALVCRYHGWTYRLDGSLTHIPHAEAFPDLDVATHGLVEIPSEEIDGLIVIDGVDLDTRQDPRDAAARVASGLFDGSPWREKIARGPVLLGASTSTLAINWKVLVEQFLEGYHIRTTHRETFFPVQYDDLNVVEAFGPNSRVTYPYRNIERLRDRDVSSWTIDARVTFVYHLFPNAMIATFPDRILLVAIDPLDVGHTSVTTYSLGEPAPGETAPGRPNGGAPDEASLVARGVVEDNDMSLAVQLGLHAGANEFLEFGRHESAIGHFHRMLDERLSMAAPTGR